MPSGFGESLRYKLKVWSLYSYSYLPEKEALMKNSIYCSVLCVLHRFCRTLSGENRKVSKSPLWMSKLSTEVKRINVFVDNICFFVCLLQSYTIVYIQCFLCSFVFSRSCTEVMISVLGRAYRKVSVTHEKSSFSDEFRLCCSAALNWNTSVCQLSVSLFNTTPVH